MQLRFPWRRCPRGTGGNNARQEEGADMAVQSAWWTAVDDYAGRMIRGD